MGSTECQVPISKCQVPSANFQVPISKCQFPSINFQVPSANIQVPSANHQFQPVNWIQEPTYKLTSDRPLYQNCSNLCTAEVDQIYRSAIAYQTDKHQQSFKLQL